MNSHLSDRQLIDYAYQALSEGEREAITLHLGACPDCRARLDIQESLAQHLHLNLAVRREQLELPAGLNFAAAAPRLKRSRRVAGLANLSRQLAYQVITVVVLAVVGLGLYALLSHFDPLQEIKESVGGQRPEGVMLGGGPQRTGVFDTTGPEVGVLLWKTEAKLDYYSQYIAPAVAVAGGKVYIGNITGKLLAVDAQTGQPRWAVEETTVAMSPVVAEGTVYVGGLDGYLYAFDSETGQEKWRFKTNGPVPTAALVLDGLVYLGSEDSYLYALDGQTGREKWRFDTGGPILTSPAAADGLVYVDNQAGYLYAVDGQTGREKWRFEAGRIESPSLAVAKGMVYLADQLGMFYAVDSQTGQERWRFNTGGAIRHSAPAVVAGQVYIGNNTGLLYALDDQTGQERWRFQTNGLIGAPAIAGDTLYVGSWDGYLVALDRASGQEKWRFAITPYYGVSQLIIADGVIYFASDDGHVYAVR